MGLNMAVLVANHGGNGLASHSRPCWKPPMTPPKVRSSGSTRRMLKSAHVPYVYLLYRTPFDTYFTSKKAAVLEK